MEHHAYEVLDIFSCYVVGWRVERIEDGQLAADLVQDIVLENGRGPPGYLHANGGAAIGHRVSRWSTATFLGSRDTWSLQGANDYAI